jgi:thiamine biosynthesis lipoprotein
MHVRTLRPTSDPLNSVSRLRIGMGTIIAVGAEADTAQRALCGLEAAFCAIAQVERLMHPTRAGSDLLAIHHGPRGRPVDVHAWTWEVLALSQRLNLVSGGAFDPCLADCAGRIADLELASAHCVIAHLPLRIDLGGIAKGFAVDCALAALRAAGCRRGLVNAGGDLAVFGAGSHSVVIRYQGRDGMVGLNNAALATSDVCSPARPAEHRGYYHGVDRRAIAAGRVSISAPSAAVADGLTKCVLADHGAASASLLEAFDATLVAGEFYP